MAMWPMLVVGERVLRLQTRALDTSPPLTLYPCSKSFRRRRLPAFAPCFIVRADAESSRSNVDSANPQKRIPHSAGSIHRHKHPPRLRRTHRPTSTADSPCSHAPSTCTPSDPCSSTLLASRVAGLLVHLDRHPPHSPWVSSKHPIPRLHRSCSPHSTPFHRRPTPSRPQHTHIEHTHTH